MLLALLFGTQSNALLGPPLARASLRHRAPVARDGAKYVLGLNQYSHDAGCALLSLDSSEAVVVPKERVSRVKCDGGGVASAVEAALAHAGASADDVVLVVANNHHFRVSEFEAALPWRVGLGLQPAECLDPLNLLPGIEKRELSHHLAHAWSVIASAPFKEGLIVIMDGVRSLSQTPAFIHSSPTSIEAGVIRYCVCDVSLYIHIYPSIYASIDRSIYYISIYPSIYPSIYLSIQHIHTHINIHTQTHRDTHRDTHICIYIYICIYM